MFKIYNSILAETNHGNINIGSENLNYEYKEILKLLKYASFPFLEKLVQKLKQFKKTTDEF